MAASRKDSNFPLSIRELTLGLAVVVGFGLGLLGVYLSMPASDYSFLKLPRTLEELQTLRMAIEEQRQLGQESTKTGEEANANVDSINSERTIQETNKPNEKSEKRRSTMSSSQEEPPCVEKDMVSVAAKTKGSLQRGRDLGDKKAKTIPRSQNLKGKHTVPQPFSLATDKRLLLREKKNPERPASSLSIYRNSGDKSPNPLRTLQTHTSLGLKSAPKDKGHSERQTEAMNMNKLERSASFKAMPLPRFYSKKSSYPNADALEKVEKKVVQKLQRSSTFRASPLPSLYHKKTTPPKPELVKIPSTRAKSRNLGPKSKSLANTRAEGMNKATTVSNMTSSCGEELEKTVVSSTVDMTVSI